MFPIQGCSASWAQWSQAIRPTPSTCPGGLCRPSFSAPVLFAIERGNYDLLIIPFLVGGVYLSEKEPREAQALGGALIATAVWLKLYPALLVLGLVSARRFRTVFWTIVWVGLIAIADVAELMQFHLNTEIHVTRAKAIASWGGFVPCSWNHSLTLSWPAIWKLTPLAKVNGLLGGIAVIGGLISWVGFEFWRRYVPAELLKPYLLWIVAAATFLPPVSNDYNLAPLLLVLMAVWQRQHLFNWVTLAALIVWAQPVGTEIPGIPMMFIKLVGLGG